MTQQNASSHHHGGGGIDERGGDDGGSGGGVDTTDGVDSTDGGVDNADMLDGLGESLEVDDSLEWQVLCNTTTATIRQKVFQRSITIQPDRFVLYCYCYCSCHCCSGQEHELGRDIYYYISYRLGTSVPSSGATHAHFILLYYNCIQMPLAH